LLLIQSKGSDKPFTDLERALVNGARGKDALMSFVLDLVAQEQTVAVVAKVMAAGQ